MPGLLKFSIGQLGEVRSRWQTWSRPVVDDSANRGILLVEPAKQTAQRTVHPVASQSVDVTGLGLIEKLGHVGGRDDLALEARLQALETEGRQHEQPRDERNEQPRHKAEVNTAKVSAGSQNVVVKDRLRSRRVGPAQ